MAGRLNAKTAVITGSSRGIGKSVAQVFAVEGARVLIVGRDSLRLATPLPGPFCSTGWYRRPLLS